MGSIQIGGGMVEYEFVGNSADPTVIVTPGGRFSKAEPAIQRFAKLLSERGLQVLLWDRPNCGLSDVQFFGPTESHMRAETLAGLVRALGVAPCVIAGGSGGARDSLLAGILHPEIASKVVVWSIVGGVYGTVALSHNVLPTINVLNTRGLPGVFEVEPWRSLIERNPRNKARLTEVGESGLLQVMLRWLNAFIPRAGQAVPGVDDELFARVRVPTLIIRSGAHDLNHPKRTTLELSCLIEGSRLVEPPWREDAWEHESRLRLEGRAHIFDYWSEGVPLIADFISEPVESL